MSWQEVKEKYMEFFGFSEFNEDMARDVDFGYWLSRQQSNWHFISDNEIPPYGIPVIVMMEDKRVIPDNNRIKKCELKHYPETNELIWKDCDYKNKEYELNEVRCWMEVNYPNCA